MGKILTAGLLVSNAVTGYFLYKEHNEKVGLEDQINQLNEFASSKLGFDVMDAMLEANALMTSEIGQDIVPDDDPEPIQPTKRGKGKNKPEKVEAEIVSTPTPAPQTQQ